MENDAPVVGPDALTANSKMVKLDIATGGLESASFRFVRDPGIIGRMGCGAVQTDRENIGRRSLWSVDLYAQNEAYIRYRP